MISLSIEHYGRSRCIELMLLLLLKPPKFYQYREHMNRYKNSCLLPTMNQFHNVGSMVSAKS